MLKMSKINYSQKWEALDLNSPLNFGSVGVEKLLGTFGNGVISAC